jgi:hypothetical protein
MHDKHSAKIVGGLIQRVLIDMPYELTRTGATNHTKLCDESFAALKKATKAGDSLARGSCGCPKDTAKYTPQVEAMVVEVVAHPKHAEVAVCRNVESHGLHTAPGAMLTVVRGDTEASKRFKATLRR